MQTAMFYPHNINPWAGCSIISGDPQGIHDRVIYIANLPACEGTLPTRTHITNMYLADV